ncbi:MMPL family transporter [Corynebacterium phoceense]
MGGLVGARPKLVTAVSLLLLAVCASGYFHISTGLTQSDQFLDTPESISAGTELEEKFPEQSATPTIIATRDADAVKEALPDARETGAANGWTLFQSSADFSELRGRLPGETYVGGSDAQLADEESAAADDRRTIFPLVLALVCGALILMLRSLLAPLIMVTSVLLTNVAALGLGWWVSHYIFGFDRFASTTPLFAFVFLVALGIDYTIFLITRAREDARSVGTRRGVLTALSATGGVITSAGILLAAVFAALGVLPLVVLAQLGITVFIGVLLDTLIVRTVLVPAIVQLLGEKFWWPAHPTGKSDSETVSLKSAGSPAAQRS